MVFRKDLLELLQRQPATASELALMLDVHPREIQDDLEHLMRSLRHSAHHLVVEPAYCRKCGFVFSRDKLGKPGRCPRCRETWIAEPRFHVE
jgi:predicted Zn-ribbon and HTH transcriptional regulator